MVRIRVLNLSRNGPFFTMSKCKQVPGPIQHFQTYVKISSIANTFFLPRACAYTKDREREDRARSRLWANAVGDEETSGGSGDDTHLTSTSQDLVLERKFHALSGRVTVGDGWGY